MPVPGDAGQRRPIHPAPRRVSCPGSNTDGPGKGTRRRLQVNASLPSSATRVLRLQQLPLPPHPPGVAARRAVACDHAMAGNQKRDGVARAGVPDGARAAGASDPSSNFRIRTRSSPRDRAERPPDFFLKRGSVRVKSRTRERFAALQTGGDPLEQAAQGGFVLPEDNAWKLLGESRPPPDGRIKGKQANAPSRRRRKKPSLPPLEGCRPENGKGFSDHWDTLLHRFLFCNSQREG